MSGLRNALLVGLSLSLISWVHAVKLIGIEYRNEHVNETQEWLKFLGVNAARSFLCPHTLLLPHFSLNPSLTVEGIRNNPDLYIEK